MPQAIIEQGEARDSSDYKMWKSSSSDETSCRFPRSSALADLSSDGQLAKLQHQAFPRDECDDIAIQRLRYEGSCFLENMEKLYNQTNANETAKETSCEHAEQFICLRR